MRRSLVVALAAIVALAAVGVVAWQAYRAVVGSLTPQTCRVVLPDGGSTSLSGEQARNAAIIVAASIERGLPERAAVVALATAYQESDIRNLDYGDRDSLGLFQQRPSYGWGTEEQIMDPWYSSGRFYEELVKFPGWESVDVNDMAQRVQRSGFPDAYRQHESKATAVAAALRGSAPETLSCLARDENPPDPAAFSPVLEAWGDQVTTTVEGDVVTITASSDIALWSAAHLALANTYESGLTAAVVGDREWTASDHGWQPAATPAPPGTATLTLG
ncbi:hypothetical protein [Tessaracoccus flavus]|uniref:Uncharacterized protein n=1 Tax=Tessaracoccus flavus TaxID=1610493 RepID=A0A1Q2CGD5_9ACTN|nr:hypothetical protein [Tessaracoccus flavus]AQP45120.1 hypothetical protein RPIT_10220 [Tessaracoccus flavus]SDY55874.1 hypothetical protein SAMN05428934_102261 [Tessaracoccus flavus]